MASHRYQFCGLSVTSDLPLPLQAAVAEDGAPATITIHQGDITRRVHFESKDEMGCYFASEDEACLFFPWVGRICVRAGEKILYEALPNQESSLLGVFLTGAALGILMHQRGHVTLHASAVSFGGYAVGFMGWKGMGKTAIAAALYGHGHPLLADDTIIFDREKSGWIWPGVTQMRAAPDIFATILKRDPKTLPRLHPSSERRKLDLGSEGLLKPLPLQAVYSIGLGDALRIEPLSSKEGFLEFVRHAYAPRHLGNGSISPHYFSQLHALAQAVPVYRLERLPDMNALDALVQALQMHQVAAS